MKRSASAALAAVTALSLAVAPAYAQDDANGPKEDQGASSSQAEGKDGEKTGSSDITDEAAKDYFEANKDKATGIVKALEILGDTATKPLVVRLDGNNVEEGRRILAEADHPLVTTADTMDAGADKAAELANSALANK